MPTECSQTNIPFKTTHRCDGGTEHHTPVTCEESDIKPSYCWKQRPEMICYFDHPVTKIITPLEHNSSWKGLCFARANLIYLHLQASRRSGFDLPALHVSVEMTSREGKQWNQGHEARISRSAGELSQDLLYLLHFSITGCPDASLLASQVGKHVLE